MPKIKICGLRRIEDIRSVNLAGPDYIGFVFAESPRQVGFQEARALKAALADNIEAVGVFVNAAIGDIANLCREGTVDLIQLHGDEDAKYIAALKNEVANPVIKAVRVKSREDVLAAAKLPSDYLLFDAYQTGLYGGGGRPFDWSLLPAVPKPFFLAGGLKAANIKEAAAYQPYCLDLSSGVETNGHKDRKKILEIIKLARSEQQ